MDTFWTPLSEEQNTQNNIQMKLFYFQIYWSAHHIVWRMLMKFGLSEKHTKFEKIFLMVLTFT